MPKPNDDYFAGLLIHVSRISGETTLHSYDRTGLGCLTRKFGFPFDIKSRSFSTYSRKYSSKDYIGKGG